LKDHWLDWIGQDAVDSFAKWGYFSTDLKKPNGDLVAPGAKLIALNTQAWNTDNWWIAGEREDPGGQIKWLEEQLVAIEKAGGIAII